MDRLKDVENHVAGVTDRISSVYVPPFQLTKGQAPPIAANGGLSYMLKLYRLKYMFMRPAAISPPGELVVEHNV
jgi:hypothetical protein